MLVEAATEPPELTRPTQMQAARAVAQRSKLMQEETEQEIKRRSADARAIEAQRKLAEVKKLQMEEKRKMKQEIEARKAKHRAALSLLHLRPLRPHGGSSWVRVQRAI